MERKSIYMTKFDHGRLKELLGVAHAFSYSGRLDLAQLAGELDRAKIVDSKKIPADVVTMNSKVEIFDLDTQETMIYALVFPRDANIDEGRISILAPLGTAILGYRAGDEFEWEVPSGKRRLKIVKIPYQPEAAGDYDR
jgi:regulator of nucleoside diphosphate kinase